jgi:hypothetical protein
LNAALVVIKTTVIIKEERNPLSSAEGERHTERG